MAPGGGVGVAWDTAEKFRRVARAKVYVVKSLRQLEDRLVADMKELPDVLEVA